MKNKKWKYDKDKKLYENVEALGIHHELNTSVTEDILELAKRAYIEGSNTTYKIFNKDHQKH